VFCAIVGAAAAMESAARMLRRSLSLDEYPIDPPI
jgi:hypothetical protein